MLLVVFVSVEMGERKPVLMVHWKFSLFFSFYGSLHVACGVGASTKVIHSIIKCYPEAVLMRTTKGSTPKQCLNLTNASNKEEVRNLIRKYFMQVESRYRPIQTISSELVLV